MEDELQTFSACIANDFVLGGWLSISYGDASMGGAQHHN